jgi:hypothetical protein
MSLRAGWYRCSSTGQRRFQGTIFAIRRSDRWLHRCGHSSIWFARKRATQAAEDAARHGRKGAPARSKPPRRRERRERRRPARGGGAEVAQEGKAVDLHVTASSFEHDCVSVHGCLFNSVTILCIHRVVGACSQKRASHECHSL